MRNAFLNMIFRHKARTWIAVTLAASTGIGVVAACGSDSEGADGTVTANDAGEERGLVLPPPPRQLAVTIAAGGDQACVVIDDGRLLCWGDNYYGQLGNPPGKLLPDGGYEFDDRPIANPTPAAIQDVTRVTTMGGPYDDGFPTAATCAVLTDAQAQCWGRNFADVLGRGKIDGRPSPQPQPVKDLGPSQRIVTSGGTSCAISAGHVFCWGDDRHWTDADGGGREVTGLGYPNIEQVALGEFHGCALTPVRPGYVYCWGLDEVTRGAQQVLFRGGSVAEIAAGGGTTCARMESGGVQCFGSNRYGLLGRGAPDGAPSDPTPAPVILPTDKAAAVQLAMSPTHACALLNDGTVWCWGKNEAGALGSGQSNGISVVPTESSIPLRVEGLPGAPSAISAGRDFTCALLVDHSVVCWGSNKFGKLGQGTFDDVPHVAPLRVGF